MSGGVKVLEVRKDKSLLDSSGKKIKSPLQAVKDIQGSID